MFLPLMPAEVRLGSKEARGPRRFRLLAYTGAVVSRAWGRLVIELRGIEVPRKLAILLEHDDAKRIGVGNKSQVTHEGLVLDGSLLENAEAVAVARDADQGFPFKASIGARFLETEDVPAGRTVRVNGEELEGPLVVARKSVLFETSFITANPADLETSATVLSGASAQLSTHDARALRIEDEQLLAARFVAARAEERARVDRLVAELREDLAPRSSSAPRPLASLLRDEARGLLASALALGADTSMPFGMLAYSGAPVFVDSGRTVFDLEGLRWGDALAVLRGHERDPVALATEVAVTDAGLEVAGFMLATPRAQKVADLNARGLSCTQASIGAAKLRTVSVRRGERVEVNGRELVGPLTVATRARLTEVSFVRRGADASTWARIDLPLHGRFSESAAGGRAFLSPAAVTSRPSVLWDARRGAVATRSA